MANFAVESQIDLIADDLGIDPLEFRLRNVYREGDKGPAGETLASVSIESAAQGGRFDRLERAETRARANGAARASPARGADHRRLVRRLCP